MDYQEVYQKTKSILMDYLHLNTDEITPDTHLVDDLVVDSIAMVEIGFRLAEAFSIPMPQPTDELFIMKNLVQFLTEQIHNE
jgi:Acyl carrier protein